MNVYIVAASDVEEDAERRLRWGDYWFKDSLGTALRGLGHGVVTSVTEADVLINCHGFSLQWLPDHTYNVLWVIGHPDAVTPNECWQYDAVYSESEEFAEHLREQGVTCKWLPGASDFVHKGCAPHLFRRVFVGNARGGSRPCIDALNGNYDGLTIWGEGWEHLPAGVWKGEYLDHSLLNMCYGSAWEVLNDTHADMERWGMHNPRYYDILATRGEKVPTFAECAEHIMRDIPEKRYMLDLGCGKNVRRGFVGVDGAPGSAAEIQWDLEQGMPPLSVSLDVIVADNLMEHIRRFIPLMNGCHRSLKPCGRMHITVPNALESPEAAFSDPTHVRAFTPSTFDYFNGEHQRWREYGEGYGILPWRVIAMRERDRFIDVMLRPV